MKVDGIPVMLTWVPPAGAPKGASRFITERGFAFRLWNTWAYWTIRGATGFTWRKPGCRPCAVSMTRDEALAYLRQPMTGMGRWPRGWKELAHLQRLGLIADGPSVRVEDMAGSAVEVGDVAGVAARPAAAGAGDGR